MQLTVRPVTVRRLAATSDAWDKAVLPVGLLQNYESPLYAHGAECGILVYEPIRLTIGRTDRPFRRLGRSRPESALRYVSWNLFLLFWLIGWILRIYGMLLGGYGYPATTGIEYRLLPYKVTAQELDALDRGIPLVNADGVRLFDPAMDEIVRLQVGSSGQLTLNGTLVKDTTTPRAWSRWTPRASDGRVVVAIEIATQARYQDLVAALDWLQHDWQARRRSRGQVVVVSLGAP